MRMRMRAGRSSQESSSWSAKAPVGHGRDLTVGRPQPATRPETDAPQAPMPSRESAPFRLAPVFPPGRTVEPRSSSLAITAPVQLDGGDAGGLGPAGVQSIARAGLSGPAGALPHLRPIQLAFGPYDVSSARAYVGEPARAANRALGSSGYVADGAVAFSRTPSLRTATHEAAHLVQQRKGVHLPGGVGRAGDRYERHADAVTERVVAGRSAVDLLDATPAGSGSGGVQRLLEVGGRDWTVYGDNAGQVQARADQVLAQIDLVIAPHHDLAARFNGNRAAIREQLVKWIEHKPGGPQTGPGTHPLGRKFQDRHYDRYVDLAWGLLGWVEAKPGRREERHIANTVYRSATIDQGLDRILGRILSWIKERVRRGQLNQARAEDELGTGQVRSAYPGNFGKGGRALHLGHYYKYYDQDFQNEASYTSASYPDQQRRRAFYHARLRPRPDMLGVLANPGSYKLKDKIIVLHDLMEYFHVQLPWTQQTAGTGLLVEAANRERGTTAVNPRTGARTADTDDRGKGPRGNATRDETAAATIIARRLGFPIWSGTSFTAWRMFSLAHQAGANSNEIGAMAFALASFWRLDYDHTVALAPHTFHETLDVAHNFGANYNLYRPTDQLIAYEPGYVRNPAHRAPRRLPPPVHAPVRAAPNNRRRALAFGRQATRFAQRNPIVVTLLITLLLAFVVRWLLG